MKRIYFFIIAIWSFTILYAQLKPVNNPSNSAYKNLSGYEITNGHLAISDFYKCYEFYKMPYTAFAVKQGARYEDKNEYLYGFIDAKGSYIFPPLKSYFSPLGYEQSIYLDYTFIFLHEGRWGAIDILGNEIVPFKYKTAEKVLKSKEWKNKLSLRKDLEKSEKYQEKIDELEFKRMIAYLPEYRKAAYSDIMKFERGNVLFERVQKKGLYGVIDAFGNYFIPIAYTTMEIAFSKEPYNRLIPVKTKQQQEYYEFIDYTGNITIPANDYQVKEILTLYNKSKDESYYHYKNKDGEQYYMSISRRFIPLVSFITNYVTLNMNYWNEKNEFESPEDYSRRLEDKFQHKAKEYFTRCAFHTYINLFPETKPFQLCDYDAANQSFLVKSDIGEIAILVPTEYSMHFRQQWEAGKVICNGIQFNSNENGIRMINLKFQVIQPKGYGMFFFEGDESTTYYAYNVNQQDRKIQIQIHSGKNDKPEEKEIYIAQSDIDKNIPQSLPTNEQTFAVIIANEDYENVPKVSFALRDGNTFATYCHKTLGIPQKNISIYENATSGKLIDAVEKIKRLSTAYNGHAKFLFYYAGHGVPDNNNKTYLMPTDASIHTIARTGLSLKQLYDDLGNCPTPLITVFLDACFSGVTREGAAIAEDRGVVIDIEESHPQKGNIIIFSASDNNQTAVPYKEKSHGVFTYFLLKKIQETKGDVYLGDLFEYVKQNVQQTVATKKDQIPGIAYSPEMFNRWKTMSLK